MILENDFLQIEVSASGAELTRIYNKKTEQEFLWEADPAFWKRHSPILFPNVGKTYNNTMLINGNSYPTSQHGFARDMEFTCTSQSADTISFLLKDNEETRKRYPFPFELSIQYTLKETSITVAWNVYNPGEETMYFTIGGHPAFRFPSISNKKEDYALYFPGLSALTYKLIDVSCGCADVSKEYSLQLTDSCYPLSEQLFEKDALIFDDYQINEVWLSKKEAKPFIGIRCNDFPNLGIWSVKNAPFVCLEPWAGRCDNVGFSDEISKKPNINTLPPKAVFQKSYDILITL